MQLRYFQGRGVAETTRYMLAIACVEYDDFRYSLTFGVPGDFSTMQRPEFDADKAAGKLDASLGKVPLLIVDGVEIAQSKAIERYVARKYGMMGSSDEEAAQIDAFGEHVRDLKDAYQKAKAADAKTKFFEETLPETLVKIEKTISSSPGSFLFGDKASYADVAWFVFAKEYFDDKDLVDAALASSAPTLKTAIDAVANLPQVVEWQKKRPVTPF